MFPSAALPPAVPEFRVVGGPEHLPGVHTRAGNAMNRTRAGLLSGAARAFAEHGLRRSTMQSIAAAAGVAKATLYNHFRTKDEVVAALLAVELDRLTAVAVGLPRDQALAALSDELGAHPVLRRLAATEPEVLTSLLAVDTERWAELTARLAVALHVDDDGAELAARWLLGVVLQPGRSTTRRRLAGRLATVLAAGPGDA
jgi:AcrR family transcriptional regulator